MATAARLDNAERQARHDLAACYRLAAKYGMTDTIYTHISARIPGTEDILINRFGDQFHCQLDGRFHDIERSIILTNERSRRHLL